MVFLLDVGSPEDSGLLLTSEAKDLPAFGRSFLDFAHEGH